MDGQKRNANGLTEAEFLAGYDPDKYKHPSVTVDMAVFTAVPSETGIKPAVLLIKRKNHPFIGGWALPGGFVDMDEELSDAAERELFEETGVKGIQLRQVCSLGYVARDPRTRVISVLYAGIAPMHAIVPKGGDDAADARLFAIDVVPESFTGGAATYKMTLTEGGETLNTRCIVRSDELSEYPVRYPGGDLASDHSFALLTALFSIKRLRRNAMTKLLSREDASRRNEIDQAYENLFAELIGDLSVKTNI